MRAVIESWLLRNWYDPRRPPWYLRMLVPVYRAVYQRIQKNSQAGSRVYRPGLPLIVVGNITAGGSGKTPLVIRLCQIALDMNFRPGIATTGYGRKSRDTLVVHADSDARICGDEPVLLALRTGVPVVVAAHRLDAVKRLNKMDLNLLISDDGLQQADLDRDIEFCVVDGERGFGNAYLLPAGPLREPADRLSQVDHVVTNGEWVGRPGNLKVNVMQLRARVVRSLDDATEYSVEQYRYQNTVNETHAIAGIGNPERFFRMLESLGIEAESHRFADHHSFTREDFDSIRSGSAIIMTEKDAVKCRSFGLKNAWYVPVDTCLSDEFEGLLRDQLSKLMKENR